MAVVLTMLTLVLGTAGPLPLGGQDAATERPEDQVKRLEREWLDAYEKNDAEAMDRIVADDFTITITFPNGSVQTEPELMAGTQTLRPAGQPAPRFFTEDVKARSYGDTVILIGRVVTEQTRGGQAVREESRYTDTYVKRGGKWQVVASHMSTVPAAKK